MAVETRVEVYGIKAALKELNKIAPTLRRQITKDYKEIVSGVIKDAQSVIPTIGPMTGMEKGWKTKSGYEMLPPGGWNGVKASKLVTAKISTRKVKEFRGTKENVGTFRLVWSGLVNTVFDIAGRKSKGNESTISRIGSHGKAVGTVGGRQMIAVLNSRYGSGSRAMWPAFQRNETEVMNRMTQLVEEVMAQVGRNVQINSGS